MPNFEQRYTKNIHWRKDNIFKKWCLESWISTWRKIKQDCCFSPCKPIPFQMESGSQLMTCAGDHLVLRWPQLMSHVTSQTPHYWELSSIWVVPNEMKKTKISTLHNPVDIPSLRSNAVLEIWLLGHGPASLDPQTDNSFVLQILLWKILWGILLWRVFPQPCLS